MSTGVKWDMDNCGGHSDKHQRYHYHSMPICLMRAMQLYTPDTGNDYIKAGSVDGSRSGRPRYPCH